MTDICFEANQTIFSTNNEAQLVQQAFNAQDQSINRDFLLKRILFNTIRYLYYTREGFILMFVSSIITTLGMALLRESGAVGQIALGMMIIGAPFTLVFCITAMLNIYVCCKENRAINREERQPLLEIPLEPIV